MEQLSHNVHMKLQEMCDCYLDTDFLSEMEREIPVQSDTLEEEAMRYFALLIMYTLTIKAQKLSVKVKRKKGVKVTVTSADDKKSLDPPPVEIAAKMFEIIRAITHIDEDQGETDLALGLRNGQVDLHVKLKKGEDEETMKILFPELEP